MSVNITVHLGNIFTCLQGNSEINKVEYNKNRADRNGNWSKMYNSFGYQRSFFKRNKKNPTIV